MAWEKKIRFTVEPYCITGTVTNFPLLIHLHTQSGRPYSNPYFTTDLSFLFTELGYENRKKIKITSVSDLDTQYNAEILSWDDTAKSAFLRVLIPVISESVREFFIAYDINQQDNIQYISDTPAPDAYIGYKGFWNFQKYIIADDVFFHVPNSYADDESYINLYPTSIFAAKTSPTGAKYITTPDRSTSSMSQTYGQSVSFYFPSDFSVEFFGKLEMYNAPLLISLNPSMAGEHRFYLRIVGDYFPQFYSAGTGASVTSTVGVSPGDWVYICAMREGGVLKILVNGTMTTGDTCAENFNYPTLVGDVLLGTHQLWMQSSAVSFQAVALSGTARSTAWGHLSLYNYTEKSVKFEKYSDLSVWKYKLDFYINSIFLDSDLTDFPLLLHLSDFAGEIWFGETARDLSFIFSYLGYANRKKIAITPLGSETQCCVEIMYWDDTAKSAFIRFKAPSLSYSANNYFSLYFDADQNDNTAYVYDTPADTAVNDGTPYNGSYIGFWNLCKYNGSTSPFYSSILYQVWNWEQNPVKNLTYSNISESDKAVSGWFSSAVHLDGIDDNLQRANADLGYNNFGTGDFTVECLCKIETLSDHVILYGSISGGCKFWIEVKSGAVQFVVYPTSKKAISGEDIVDGLWYYIVGRRESGVVKISVNGVDVTGESGSTDNFNALGNLYIGKDAWGGQRGPLTVQMIALSVGAQSDAWIDFSYNNLREVVQYLSLSTNLDADESINIASAGDAVSFSEIVNESIDVSSGGDAVSFSEIVNESINVSSGCNANAEWSIANTENIEVMATGGGDGTIFSPAEVFAGVGLAADTDGLNFSQWLRRYAAQAQILYFFRLSLDGLAEIEIPISSFQSRMRSGQPSFLSVVIPNASKYAPEISERLGGTMSLIMGFVIKGVLILSEQVAKSRFDKLELNDGSVNVSATLSGYITETYQSQVTKLSKPIYRNITDGKYNYRFCSPDLFLKPGDTVKVDNDEFVADSVTCAVSVGQRSMTVTGI